MSQDLSHVPYLAIACGATSFCCVSPFSSHVVGKVSQVFQFDTFIELLVINRPASTEINYCLKYTGNGNLIKASTLIQAIESEHKNMQVMYKACKHKLWDTYIHAYVDTHTKCVNL